MVRKLALGFIILMPYSFSGFSSNHPWELWLSQAITQEIGKNTNFQLTQQFNTSDRLGTLYFYFTEAQVSYRFSGWFTGSAAVRRTLSSTGQNWDPEIRPHLNTAFHKNSGRTSYYFRNRMVLRYFREKNNHIRLREESGIVHPVNLMNFTVIPCATSEIFYHLNNNRVERNQLLTGFIFNPLENLNVRIGYIGIWKRNFPQWEWINGCRLDVVFSFNKAKELNHIKISQ
jgi:hypothetical protein